MKFIPSYSRTLYITKGYRPLMTPKQCITKSLCRCHNEFCNIWTHLFGFFVLLGLGIWLFVDYLPQLDMNKTDYTIFGYYIFTGCFCMIVSACMHLFINCVYPIHQFWVRMDYFGILLLFTGSDLTILWYGFECYPHIRLIYVIITPIVVFMGMIAILHPSLQGMEYRTLRMNIFISIFFISWVHLIHEMILKSTQISRILSTYFLTFSWYVIGLIFYATRIPERFSKTSRFDLIGSSHQIWHIFTLIGAIVHIYSSLIYFDYKDVC